jgi:hypothetical protein
LRDLAGRSISRAHLTVEGNMSHPGMAPVFAAVEEIEPGRYRAPIEFTMAGDWFLLVTGELPGGARFERKIDVANVRGAE